MSIYIEVCRVLTSFWKLWCDQSTAALAKILQLKFTTMCCIPWICYISWTYMYSHVYVVVWLKLHYVPVTTTCCYVHVLTCSPSKVKVLFKFSQMGHMDHPQSSERLNKLLCEVLLVSSEELGLLQYWRSALNKDYKTHLIKAERS